MNLTKHTIATLLALSMITSCIKKDPAPDPPAEPPVEQPKITYASSIGNPGTALNEFNFDMQGIEIAWTLATDGNFVYVGDFANNCVKKIDLATNTVVGWYGVQNGTWGFYTNYTTLPNKTFRPFRLMYKNGYMYALSRKLGTINCKVWKFSLDAASTIDSLRLIPELSFFTTTIDANENIFIGRNDSIIKYGLSSVTRFGGFGSGDGKFNNQTALIPMKFDNDTLNVLDTGNNRLQKFSSNGTFQSKITVTPGGYSDFCIVNNKLFLVESSKFSEYNTTGGLVKSMFFNGSPANFSPGQKQFVVVNDKVVFQDPYANKLYVFTK